MRWPDDGARSAAIALMLVLIAAFVTHAGAVGGWWLNDDPQVLLHALQNSPAEVLFQPEQWQVLSSSNFTPLVTLSFDLDLSLAGMRPRAFYLHQIASISLVLGLLFFVLRRFTGDGLAALAAVGVAVAPASIHAARSLMVRHYVEGLAIALLAILIWDSGSSAKANGNRVVHQWPLGWREWATGFLYLLAMLGKEVLIPLPLLLVGVSRFRGDAWRRVAIRITPVAFAAVVYLVWRLAMLGSAGGYQSTLDPKSAAAILVQQMATPLPSSARILALIPIGILIGMAAPVRGWTVIKMIGVAAAVVLLPLIPIAASLDVRHTLVPTVMLIAVAAVLASWVRSPRSLGVAALLALVVLSLTAGRLEANRLSDWSRLMIAEGRYLWFRAQGSSPLLAWSPEWYLEGLAELRRELGRGEGPFYVNSPHALLMPEVDAHEVVIFDGEADRYRNLPPHILAALAMQATRLEPDAPLWIRIERDGNELSWQFGPECDCQWTFLSYPHYDDYVVPREGRQRVPRPRGEQSFRVRRDEDDGSWTISPPLRMPESGDRVEWKREGSESSSDFRTSREKN